MCWEIRVPVRADIVDMVELRQKENGLIVVYSDFLNIHIMCVGGK